MSISNFLLTTGNNNGGVSSAATASVTPTGNRLQLLWVYNYKASVSTNVPAATGCSVNWVLIDSFEINSGGTRIRLSCFRGLVASPTTGAVTIDFAGQTQTVINWSLSEFSGIDTGGTDGSAAVRQFNDANSVSNVTTLSVPLGAFGDTNNGTAGGFFLNIPGTDTVTPGSGFTVIHNHASGGGDSLYTEWRSDNDTTVDCSWQTAASCIGIGVEIKVPSTNRLFRRSFSTGDFREGSRSALIFNL